MNHTRRKLVTQLGCITALASLDTQAKNAIPGNRRYESFLNWIKLMTPPDGMGLCRYMHTSGFEKSPLSTLASADATLLHLRMGNLDLARKTGDALVLWHRSVMRNAPSMVKGGMPSDFPLENGSWVPGDYFYAGDNLLTVAALIELYNTTKLDRYANTAVSIGSWLEKTLFDGKRIGVWSINYGPAMQYIRSDGAANNAIHTGMDFLWLSSLRGLHTLDPQRGWNQRLSKSIDFYRTSMSPEGCWYDYFQPHRVNESAGRWYWYKNADLTIGDNTLRSALAAHAFGLRDQTASFAKWLKPSNGKWLWGYLDPKSCAPKFLPADTVYFDVVCTGLLRSWYTKTGQQQLAAKCQQALDMLQSRNGGWHWGVKESNLQPLNSEQALVTGCWALANLA